MRIRALYKRAACVAQETGHRTGLILEVTLLGVKFWSLKIIVVRITTT